MKTTRTTPHVSRLFSEPALNGHIRNGMRRVTQGMVVNSYETYSLVSIGNHTAPARQPEQEAFSQHSCEAKAVTTDTTRGPSRRHTHVNTQNVDATSPQHSRCRVAKPLMMCVLGAPVAPSCKVSVVRRAQCC